MVKRFLSAIAEQSIVALSLPCADWVSLDCCLGGLAPQAWHSTAAPKPFLSSSLPTRWNSVARFVAHFTRMISTFLITRDTNYTTENLSYQQFSWFFWQLFNYKGATILSIRRLIIHDSWLIHLRSFRSKVKLTFNYFNIVHSTIFHHDSWNHNGKM